MKCRHCDHPLTHLFLDLGFAPPSNAYLTSDDLSRPEKYFPLKVRVCDSCWLVQTEDYAQVHELFSAEYAYFSSTSQGWLLHAKRYAEEIVEKLKLGPSSLVIEIASNDGYLLKNFVAMDIPCLGIEPTASTAEAAERQGIPILREFFGYALAKQLASQEQRADLIVGNNVYAHVPDINDFTLGLQATLKAGGTITLEFPHLLQLIAQVQFDTVYHEHFSYLSLLAVERIFRSAALRVFDVYKIDTHGGSLRVFGCHMDDPRPTSPNVNELLREEETQGLKSLDTYSNFQAKANQVKNDLLDFLLAQKKAGKKIVAYGAAAKGNTLLNYAGVKPDLLPVIFDAAAAKQGKFMPGSHIPILAPQELETTPPDYVVILPWNIAAEVKAQLSALSAGGCRFVTAVPRLEIS